MKPKKNKITCPNCQHKWQDNYCSNCGEQKLTNVDSSFDELFKQLFSSITEVDNKFIKSFRLLIFRPGQLTIDYFAGIRKSRLTPFQVFIFANIIYFFITGVFNQATFTTPLKYHINSANFIHQEIAAEMIETKLLSSGQSYKEYETAFNRVAVTQSKTLIFVFIPILTLFLMPLFFNKKIKVVRHVVYSAHFMAFLLLITILAMPLVQYILSLLNQSNIVNVIGNRHELILTLSLFILFWLYLYLSFVHIYDEHKGMLFVKSILMTGCVYYTLLIYRMFLFFTSYLVVG